MLELMMTAPFFQILTGTLSGVLASECLGKAPAWLLYFGAALYFLLSFRAFFKAAHFAAPLLLFIGSFLGAALHYAAADRTAVRREEERFTLLEACEKAVWARENENRKYYAALLCEGKDERFKVALYSRLPFPVEKGDLLCGEFKYSPLKGAATPGCFDSGAHYARENVYRAAVPKGNFIIRGSGPGSLGKTIDAVRNAAARSLSDERFPIASKLLRIMLLGSREKLPPEVERGIKKSGIAHILAVSGLHIGLLSGVWFLLTRLFGLSRLCFKLPLLPLLWLYALFLGDRPSVVRSVILMTFLVGGRILRKATLSVHFLCAAAFLYALVSPKQIFSYSSLLSYAATAALLIMLPEMDSLFVFKRSQSFSFLKKCVNFLLDYLFQSLKISLAVLIFSLPLLLAMLHMITPLGFLMNILTIPLCALLLVCGLWRMIVFFTPLPMAVSDIIWKPVMLLWDLILSFVAACGERNLFVMSFPAMKPLAVLFYYLIILFYLLSEQAMKKYLLCENDEEGRRYRRRTVLKSRALFLRRVFIVLLLSGAAVLLRPFVPSTALQVTALNVGQGDAFVISSDLGPKIVVDCGRSFNGSSQGEQILTPFLRNRGINKIDALVISHYDDDHMGGAADLIREIKTGTVLAPPLLNYETNGWDVRFCAYEKGVPWIDTAAGDRGNLKGVGFSALSPPRRPLPATSNGRSLVLLFEYLGFDLLFTGDAPGETEEAQLENLGIGRKIAVYKIPHHGSASSGNESFLRAISPAVSLLSVGKNAYGHPHARLMEKYRILGAKVLRTDELGTFTLSIRKKARPPLPKAAAN